MLLNGKRIHCGQLAIIHDRAGLSVEGEAKVLRIMRYNAYGAFCVVKFKGRPATARMVLVDMPANERPHAIEQIQKHSKRIRKRGVSCL